MASRPPRPTTSGPPTCPSCHWPRPRSWRACHSCGVLLNARRLEGQSFVCPECGHHFRIPATTRLDLLLDAESAQPLDIEVAARDVLGFVDTKRMALTGGSYAGYMTAWIVGHDHRFACVWSQRGLYNFMSFYGATDIPQLLEQEFEVLLPSDDLEKSWRQSPMAYVHNIKTPLALEHQEQDYRCPISEA